MLNLIQALLQSKKFALTLTAVLVWVLGRAGLDIPPEEILPVVAAIVGFVLAQGWADNGKEAVLAAAKAAKPADPPVA
jgi:hypothetical protein